MSKETIYALSTVFGKSGVAVFRVSGIDAIKTIEKLTDINIGKLKSRYAYFTSLKNISDGSLLDKALVIYFKNPHSFTGEDTVEIHSHGSKAVIAGIMDNLSKIENYRLAEAGEFSKRAFYNNKMDLTEAEGLADLIDAETKEQQKYALRQMSGELKGLYDGWREELVKTLAHVEAYIDFPEEDIPEEVVIGLENTVFKVKESIKNHLSQKNQGEKLREGFRVVIIGEPNAGKSSLLNTLAKREAVIVSDIAGTTRDAIDVYMDINGYPVIFTDTAGLRETKEEIEQIGITIAQSRAKEADMIIGLIDGQNINFVRFNELAKHGKDNILYVINKSDYLTDEQRSKYEKEGYLIISAKYQIGIDELFKVIENHISRQFTSTSGALITRQRYREALNDVLEYLTEFNLNKPIELAAEDVRMAARSIGKITGRIEINEILDKIFGSFCIGK